MLTLQPITLEEAKEYIKRHNRHHLPPQGWKFGIAVNNGAEIVGVIIVGRPVARAMDNGWTLEVTRCCTDGTKDACSKLYAAAWRATRALGYQRLITYTLATEPGTSVKAAGFKELYKTKGGSWDCPSRPRIDKHPTMAKTLWSVGDC